MTTTYSSRRARTRTRVGWAQVRRVAALRWYRTRWAVRRLAGWVWPLLLDTAGLALLAVAGFAVALWLGLVVAGLGCWALNLRIDRRIREVKGRTAR
jgi:hypothetical protein